MIKTLIKTYDLFRYDIPRFVKNFWLFREAIFYFRPDIEKSHLYFLRVSLQEALKMHLENHVEEDIIHSKIIEKIQRAIELLNIHINDEYLDEAERLLKMKYQNPTRHIYSPASDATTNAKNMMIMGQTLKLEERYWEELFRILKGQNAFEREPDEWGIGFPNNYDGTGINHWGD